MTSELKTCPFCGDSKHLIVDDYHDPEMKGYFGFNVICNAAGWDGVERGCGAAGAWGETKEEAVKVWNTRAVPDVPELVRYRIWFDNNYNEIVDEDPEGEYVRYNQAAKVIAAEREKVQVLEQQLQSDDDAYSSGFDAGFGEANMTRNKRAEAAEAKLAQIKGIITIG